MILRKIIKIVATRCQILRLKCTKFDFGWGSAPDPAGGAYSAPPDPVAGFKGPTSKGREGNGREGGEGKRKGREGKKGEEKREGKDPPLLFLTNRTLKPNHISSVLAALSYSLRDAQDEMMSLIHRSSI